MSGLSVLFHLFIQQINIICRVAMGGRGGGGGTGRAMERVREYRHIFIDRGQRTCLVS